HVPAAEREARHDRPLGASRRVRLVPAAGRGSRLRLGVLRPARSLVISSRRAARRGYELANPARNASAAGVSIRSEYETPLQFFEPDDVIATTVLVPLTKFGPPESPRQAPGFASTLRSWSLMLPALFTGVVAIEGVRRPVGAFFGSSPSTP